jgi:diacylglycerol kinase (ATP)
VLKRFRFALSGLAVLLASQVNARIHLAVTAAVVLVGAWLRVSLGDWCWLVLAMALVWTSEALNTALELLGDAVSGGAHHEAVGRAKDVAAAGVLVAAMAAALIGVIIFWPRIMART